MENSRTDETQARTDLCLVIYNLYTIATMFLSLPAGPAAAGAVCSVASRHRCVNAQFRQSPRTELFPREHATRVSLVRVSRPRIRRQQRMQSGAPATSASAAGAAAAACATGISGSFVALSFSAVTAYALCLYALLICKARTRPLLVRIGLMSGWIFLPLGILYAVLLVRLLNELLRAAKIVQKS